MSLSAEYCSGKMGDRGGGGGGALAHQRRLIQGLLVWATLLTLGLGTLITLHFNHRESPAPSKVQTPGNIIQANIKETPLMVFSPNWKVSDKVNLLRWKTVRPDFIKGEGKEKLMVKEYGQYFLYLQVTLHPQEKANHTITLQSEKRQEILKGLINGSKLSTIFLANGIPLDSNDTLHVTCHPEAKIQASHTETYLGVIKLS
ncbi:tumor necrosis factor ligand superfamily member 18 [Carassius gibelio]|uniref:tumor necrosis factor ligand superfamily member 18 n=1 Tax=Carassius gibelio TaxID=101364 RepID=UPI0022799F4E|nr:tumor necrosis factor ligand superfamily member 18 [Carassius gibelio]